MTQPEARAVGNGDPLPVLAQGHFPGPCSLALQLVAPCQEGRGGRGSPSAPSCKGCSAAPAAHSSVPICPWRGLLPLTPNTQNHICQETGVFDLKLGSCKPCLSLGLGNSFFFGMREFAVVPGGLGSTWSCAPKSLGTCYYRGGREGAVEGMTSF